MDPTIVITCPNCKKQLKGTPDLLGKKVRCKSCGHSFGVPPERPNQSDTIPSAQTRTPSQTAVPNAQPAKGSKPSKAPASPARKANAPAAAKTTKASGSSKPAKSPAESSIGGPYQFTTETEGVHRCPQCAFELEEDAVICLECGFNTQTRLRMGTVKTYETTAGDRLAWLLPGIICATAAAIMLGLIAFLWLLLPRLADGAWWGNFGIQVWGTVVALFVGFFTGKYAIRRLVFNPNPPEKVKG